MPTWKEPTGQAMGLNLGTLNPSSISSHTSVTGMSQYTLSGRQATILLKKEGPSDSATMAVT
jgi:hypothetical protein